MSYENSCNWQNKYNLIYNDRKIVRIVKNQQSWSKVVDRILKRDSIDTYTDGSNNVIDITLEPRIYGNFEIVKALGRGGFGQVRLARARYPDSDEPQQIALKFSCKRKQYLMEKKVLKMMDKASYVVRLIDCPSLDAELCECNYNDNDNIYIIIKMCWHWNIWN